MKKIITSVAIVAAAAAIIIGGTTAYFSDTETSEGNTFTAGAIDLKVSNESYVSNHTTGELEASPATSWVSGDLTIEKFFNFQDLKPGDVGEDTIDITVDNNDAWVCAELTLTSNEDNGCTEPELDADADPNCDPDSDELFDGELAQEIEFVWWADDGDNVLEVDEEASKYYLGPNSIKNLLGDDNKLLLTLADSQLNFFDRTRLDQNQVVLPLTGEKTYYIGKGWCFGEMELTPLAEDDGTPLVRGTGFKCDGGPVGNSSQTDKLTADLSFTAIQSRNNMNYLCPEHQPEIIKVTSSQMNFSSTGWAGWSCPASHPNIVSGTTNCSLPLANSLAWEPGATVGVYTYPTTPFGYTYASGEEGWIVQNGGTGQSCNILLDCQAD